MSFGYSVGDCIVLSQLAWNTYQGAKKACGEHDELTREVSSLYKVLNRLQRELSNPESLVHKASLDKRQELEEHAAGCEGILRTMDSVLTKFNALTGEQRRGRKLWQKIKFGNGQVKDLADIRIKLSAHTSAIMMSLNLCSLDSLGRVEAVLVRVEAKSTSHDKQLRGIRSALHWVTANMAAASGEGSVWTSYTNDDQAFWRGLRRELIKEGYRSTTLQRHKTLIKDYVEELGNRGVFDDILELDIEDSSPDGDTKATVNTVPGYLAGCVDLGEDIVATNRSLSSAQDPKIWPRECPEIETRELLPRSQQPIEAPGKPEVESDPGDKEPHSQSSHAPDRLYTAFQNVGQEDNESDSASTISAMPVTDQVPEQILAPCSDDINVVDSITLTANLARQLNDLMPQGSLDSEVDESLEDVVDEEFVRHPRLRSMSGGLGAVHPSAAGPVSRPRASEAVGDELISEIAEVLDDTKTNGSLSAVGEVNLVRSAPPPVFVEEIIDEEYSANAHPNVSAAETLLTESTAQESSDAISKSPSVSTPVPENRKASRVQFAESGNVSFEFEETPMECAQEDLRFIFYHEFRDWQIYQELQESYQALFDENEAEMLTGAYIPEQAETSTFITHSPYTPPATVYDLQYYHIPASYFHTFWHPQRNPIYLHGNVFDGISLANWIYNWTTYTFKDDSYQMNTVKRFGGKVIKLGSALSDMEHAKLPIKKNIPRDISDVGFALWAELENIINDIMTLAEDRLQASKKGGRLEVEFVRRFCHEMIAGNEFYRPIDDFLKQTEVWCKKARLHPDLALAWELFLEL
ncbi:hypothetical protein B2J93_3205 [Marssonina coronariae]|uniref:Fungal N-terminal domain-containing protein n=1 Tax=Diplocarpon coronariae TaxID=2795749 RepID=A0A218Z304_9HELO|nr:hypothetical protein B2J93_3205 [Marssonina coronariae]